MFTSPWLTLAPSPFLLQNLPDFPFQEYQNRQEIYAELNNWYSGDKLVKIDIYQATGRRVELYPLRSINPLKSIAEKHVTILLGENSLEGKVIRDPNQGMYQITCYDPIRDIANSKLPQNMSSYSAIDIFGMRKYWSGVFPDDSELPSDSRQLVLD